MFTLLLALVLSTSLSAITQEQLTTDVFLHIEQNISTISTQELDNTFEQVMLIAQQFSLSKQEISKNLADMIDEKIAFYKDQEVESTQNLYKSLGFAALGVACTGGVYALYKKWYMPKWTEYDSLYNEIKKLGGVLDKHYLYPYRPYIYNKNPHLLEVLSDFALELLSKDYIEDVRQTKALSLHELNTFNITKGKLSDTSHSANIRGKLTLFSAIFAAISLIKSIELGKSWFTSTAKKQHEQWEVVKERLMQTLLYTNLTA